MNKKGIGWDIMRIILMVAGIIVIGTLIFYLIDGILETFREIFSLR